MSNNMRKINKPELIVEDSGLLAEDETMTNQEFISVFYNTIFDESSGEMIFNTEVINKFNRFMLYQEILNPLKQRLVELQFEKYIEIADVNKENYKQLNLSIFEEIHLKNVTVFSSINDEEFVYINLSTFRKILKSLEDNMSSYIIPDEEQFISLRLWAFDNDYDIMVQEEEIKIVYNPESLEETQDEVNSEATGNCKEGNSTKDSKGLTIMEFEGLFNENYFESGSDIEIKPSIIEKLNKQIHNMEAIKPLREKFAYINVEKFIEENLHIDKFKTLKVFVNEREVCKVKVFEEGTNLYVNMFTFKLILMRTGTYYAIYLDGKKEVLVNLKKWVSEHCGEIKVSKKQLEITF